MPQKAEPDINSLANNKNSLILSTAQQNRYESHCQNPKETKTFHESDYRGKYPTAGK